MLGSPLDARLSGTSGSVHDETGNMTLMFDASSSLDLDDPTGQLPMR